MEDQTEKIDAYLSDSMTSEEKMAFELALQNDAELMKDYQLQQKTAALLEAAAFIEKKNQIRALNRQKSGPSIGANLMKVAAVLLVLLIPTYFYLNNHYNDAHLFAEYAEPFPDRITTMGSSNESTLTQAMNAYNKEDYATSAKLFKAIRLGGDGNVNVILYEAVSLTYSDQAKAAIELLEEMLNKKTADSNSIEWQLTLSLLANNEGERAKEVLNNFLKHNQGYQQEKAESLQKDLNRIWR